MLQILNSRPNLGQLLGSGLSQGIERLHKIQGLSSIGIPADQASAISSLPDQLQGLIVKNYLSAAESKGLDNALSSLNSRDNVAQDSGQGPLLNNAKTWLGSTGLGGNLGGNNGEQSNNIADLLQAPRISSQDKLKLESLKQAKNIHKEKLAAKEREIIDKETKPIYDEISKGSKSALNNNKRLDRMESLIKKGKLVGSAWGSLLDTLSNGIFGFGIDLHSLLHPDSQEFRKLSNDFLKDAKDTFGSRLTNYDVKTFLSTVPTLSQSDAGKLRVIRNLRSFNDAALIRKKALDDIIKENGGRRPANLDALVEQRVSPILDDLAKQFKEGFPSQEESDLNTSRSWAIPESLQIR